MLCCPTPVATGPGSDLTPFGNMQLSWALLTVTSTATISFLPRRRRNGAFANYGVSLFDAFAHATRPHCRRLDQSHQQPHAEVWPQSTAAILREENVVAGSAPCNLATRSGDVLRLDEAFSALCGVGRSTGRGRLLPTL